MGDRDIYGGGRDVLTLKSMHTINLITLKLMYIAHHVVSNHKSTPTLKSMHLLQTIKYD